MILKRLQNKMTQINEEKETPIFSKHEKIMVTKDSNDDFCILGHYVFLRNIYKSQLQKIIQTAAEISVDEHGSISSYDNQNHVIPLMVQLGFLTEFQIFEIKLTDELNIMGLKVEKPIPVDAILKN